MELSPEQQRVLGCLVEKQLATPQHYPLTENALLLACNQSTNREPVVDYDRDTLRRALVELRRRGLARDVHRPGERATKHRHLLADALGLDEGALALLAVLLLRGPQTSGELRARSERLHRFGDGREVAAVLEQLAERNLITQLARRPGHKETRFAHLLGEDAAALPAEPASRTATGSAAEPPRPALAERVDTLEREVAALRAELAAVRALLGGDDPSTSDRG
jgi:uncharacterized protein